ncbi:MAG: hypothetical protein COB53_06025 [Elusimicrobia bacterium]|nr:MAG: hypothetical protein COB53_06025 [Elusimicrobiota bacterium]
MTLQTLKVFALSGGDWVIWALLLASVVAVAVIVERALVLRREMESLNNLKQALQTPVADGDHAKIAAALKKSEGASSRILASAVSSGGRAAVEDRIVASALDEKRFLETRLLILGTLGNNAPFVGLFGTVLGVIRAFHDLAAHAGAGPEVVMRGLSEALIATAVGLFVAIPCVIAYNYLQKQVQDLLSSVESMSRLILAAGK